jgi:hypothetical protein
MVTSLNRGNPARETGYEMVQYIAGRVTLAGADVNVKVGTLPAGSIILWVHSKVVTAITGGTPVLAVGVASGGSTLVATMAEAAGSELLQPLTTVVQPLAADTDIWAGTSGAATAGDAVITVGFCKPLA